MNQTALRRSVSIKRSRSLLSFGPYLVVEATPWLLIATIVRLRSHAPATFLIGTQLAQLLVFMAFLLMSQRIISLLGGGTSLPRLPFRQQLLLGGAILWRVLIMSIVVLVAAKYFGSSRIPFFYMLGIDGIVFPWYGQSIPLLSAFMATFAFLMVTEKGLERKPTFRNVFTQFRLRWTYLLPAMLIVGLFLSGADALQAFTTAALEPLYVASAGPFQRYFYTGYFLGYSYLRLWIVVVILTYALRASYRHQQTDAGAV